MFRFLSSFDQKQENWINERKMSFPLQQPCTWQCREKTIPVKQMTKSKFKFWGVSLNTQKIAQSLVGGSSKIGTISVFYLQPFPSPKTTNKQIFLIKCSVDEFSHHKDSRTWTDETWSRFVSTTFSVHTHRFLSSSPQTLRFDILSVQSHLLAPQQHLLSGFYTWKSLFLEKTSASWRSLLAHIARLLTLGLSPPQVNWVFKVNVPLQEKVDKLIWWAPCCSVGCDSDRPVNLRNEV